MAVLDCPELKEIKCQDPLELSLSKLACVVFATYGYVHFLHLMTPSHAAHKALDEFYSDLPGVFDGIAETYLAQEHRAVWHKSVSLSGSGVDVCDTLLQYAKELHVELDKLKQNDAAAIINELEGFMSFVASIRYKLVRLS